MSATYRNPWHSPLTNAGDPPIYSTDAEPIEHRGFLIYRRLPRCFDVVKHGVCIGQREGLLGATNLVDLIHDKPDDYWAKRALAHLPPPISSQRQPWWGEQERLVSRMADAFEHFGEEDEG